MAAGWISSIGEKGEDILESRKRTLIITLLGIFVNSVAILATITAFTEIAGMLAFVAVIVIGGLLSMVFLAARISLRSAIFRIIFNSPTPELEEGEEEIQTESLKDLATEILGENISTVENPQNIGGYTWSFKEKSNSMATEIPSKDLNNKEVVNSLHQLLTTVKKTSNSFEHRFPSYGITTEIEAVGSSAKEMEAIEELKVKEWGQISISEDGKLKFSVTNIHQVNLREMKKTLKVHIKKL